MAAVTETGASSQSTKRIGFLGCGKISAAVCRGLATLPASQRPQRLLVSERSKEKSQALANDFPELVSIFSNNHELVMAADIVFLGLLPSTARELLPQLPFSATQSIVSMMAAVDFAELLQLLPVPASQVVRIVPLPSASRQMGPILVYAPTVSEDMSRLLALLGTPIICQEEALMKPMISVTGHISALYEYMRTTESFLVAKGVDEATARRFVASFFSSLSRSAELSSDSVEELRDEAATPGGLNEQSVRFLQSSPIYDVYTQSLVAILDRLQKR